MKLSNEPGALLSFTPKQVVLQTRPTDRQDQAVFYTWVYWMWYHEDRPEAALLKPYVDAFARYLPTLD